jgi:hypothetical protein
MKPKYKSKMRQTQWERASVEKNEKVTGAPQSGDIGCGERAGSRVY